jgi:PEP-CTERM motif
MKKLSSYLSAGIAATATFQSSDAATVVTLYGPGARTPSTTPATPTGISMGLNAGLQALNTSSAKSIFAFTSGTYQYFTTGADLGGKKGYSFGRYCNDKLVFRGGAQLGAANYANISFDGDNVFEAVGQFNFDGAGGGFLVALAINDDNSALSISQGKAAIDAVPEPSAIALLALGAGGMAMRRRRQVA